MTTETLDLYHDGYEHLDRKKGAFADMIQAIKNAKTEIMLSAWAIDLMMDFGQGENIGELLSRKANEGVQVYVTCWNRGPEPAWFPTKKRLKNNTAYLKYLNQNQYKDSFKNLHFRHVSRDGFSYSDHRKLLITDNTLFVGGLELESERDEFTHYNDGKDGWRDAHAKITGDAILKEAKTHFFKHFGARTAINPFAHIQKKQTKTYTKDNPYHRGRSSVVAPVSYNSQPLPILKPDEDDPLSPFKLLDNETKKINGKQTNDIQEKYLDIIRKAENKIYIEQQFLIGDNATTNGSSANPIPRALVEKISDARLKNEPITVEILVPSFVQAPQDSAAARIVAHEQQKTIAWMYQKLSDIGINNPDDYLEIKHITKTTDDQTEREIFIHSKLMIVDNKHAIIGSANMNERSMSGTGDAEVAVYINAKDNEGLQQTLARFTQNTDQAVLQEKQNIDPFLLKREEKFLTLKQLAHATLNQIIAKQQIGKTCPSRLQATKVLRHVVANAATITEIINAFAQQQKIVKGVKSKKLFQVRSSFLYHVEQFMNEYQQIMHSDKPKRFNFTENAHTFWDKHKSKRKPITKSDKVISCFFGSKFR